MAAIKIRTPEDLDKVFQDVFYILYEIQHRVSNIEGQLYKHLSMPTTIGPTWSTPTIYGPIKTSTTVEEIKPNLSEELKSLGEVFKKYDKKTSDST